MLSPRLITDMVIEAVKEAGAVQPDKLLPWGASDNDLLIVRQSLMKDPVGYRYVEMFEETLAKLVGVKHAVAVNSGTSAIHLALLAAGIGEGDEVIVPSLAFAGVAAAVTYTGASPHFVDCLHSPLGAINPYKLRRHLTTYRHAPTVKALIAVDLLGRCSVMPELTALCRERGIVLIEDAAAAIGSSAFGRKCGAFGNVATMSFNNNKLVTTNGGGALLTNDDDVAAKARHRGRTAKKDNPWFYDHDQIGFNYRMPNILAALAIDQFMQLQNRIRLKTALAHSYHVRLSGSGQVSCVNDVADMNSNYWLNAIMVADTNAHRYVELRDLILAGMKQAGLASRALFTPLHLAEPYAHYPRQRDLTVAEDLFNRTICLPSGI